MYSLVILSFPRADHAEALQHVNLIIPTIIAL